MSEADIVLPLKEGSIDRKDSHQLRRSMQAQILYATTTTEPAAQVYDSTVTAKKVTQHSSYHGAISIVFGDRGMPKQIFVEEPFHMLLLHHTPCNVNSTALFTLHNTCKRPGTTCTP